MNPSNFRHRITFVSSTRTQDELGQYIETESDFKTVWAMIKTVKGSEFFGAAAILNENTYRFIIRHTTGIEPIMTIRFDGRFFDIQSVLNDDEGNKTLTIIANEKVT